MESCCYGDRISFQFISSIITDSGRFTYSDFHALPGDEFHAAHGVLFHLDELRQLLGEIGSEGTGGVLAESMAWSQDVSEFNFFIFSISDRSDDW